MKLRDYLWPVIGVLAAVFSGWILYRELRGLSLSDVIASFHAIGPGQWAGSICAAFCAYLLLALYDQLALKHLRRRVSFPFVAATSFATYALSHNIGASVFSGAVVRYRAYTSRGLNGKEVALLIGFCSLTFALGIVTVGAVTLMIEPSVLARYFEIGPGATRAIAGAGLALIALYLAGSVWGFKPLTIGSFRLEYPRRSIVLRQLLVGPLEIVAAASIIYFALPPEASPGYVTVVAIFAASFSLALISHAPGGLGVLEVSFLIGLSDVPETEVLAALFVFRILYLLLPFAVAIVMVLMFEHGAMRRRANPLHNGAAGEHPAKP